MNTNLMNFREKVADNSIYFNLLVLDLEKTAEFYEQVIGLQLVMMDTSMGWAEFELPVKGVRLGLRVTDDPSQVNRGQMSINAPDIDPVLDYLQEQQITVTNIQDIPNTISIATINDPNDNEVLILGRPRIIDKS